MNNRKKNIVLKILFYHLTVLNRTIRTANVNVLPIIETI